MSIRINVDPTNPGQFFACCGLLELADRIWDGAEGAFSSSGAEFRLSSRGNPDAINANELLDKFASCAISSTMSDAQTVRLKGLLLKGKASLTAQELAERRRLSELRGLERLRLHDPFNVWIDWWGEERAGGSKFKTWAGKQFVIDITRSLHSSVKAVATAGISAEQWLFERTRSDSLPFYFDSDGGNLGSDRDVGFSFDPLRIRVQTRPLTELLAFIGLQRFRPLTTGTGKRYRYSLWSDPLAVEVAQAAACGLMEPPLSRTFEFRLFYRTKYLKSFLPATPL